MPETYTHSPRPTGGPITFTLSGGQLTVDSARAVQEVRLAAVRDVRLTYEPQRFAYGAFTTRVRLVDGTAFALSSLSWRSLVAAERRDADYSAFATALLRAIATASPQARFRAGRPPAIWAATAVLAFASLVAVAVFIWSAVATGATEAALTGALVLAVGLWQLEPMVRLNRPKSFRPDAPPRELLP